MKEKLEQTIGMCLLENGYSPRIVWLEDVKSELDKKGLVTFEGRLQLSYEKIKKETN